MIKNHNRSSISVRLCFSHISIQ